MIRRAMILQKKFCQIAPFDWILLDAPCTNTGVMRRRIDVRWRLRPEDFSRMSNEQLIISRAVFRLLKPGGILVYSTCSLEPEENNRSFAARCRAAVPGFGNGNNIHFLFATVSMASPRNSAQPSLRDRQRASHAVTSA